MDMLGNRHQTTAPRTAGAVRDRLALADADLRELRSIVIEFDEMERQDVSTPRP